MIDLVLSDEQGSSIVEIGVSLVITAMLTVAMVSWMTSAGAAVTLHREDDVVVQDLRIAKERITRELRVAEDVSVATRYQVTVWVDDDDDDFADPGETITWYFGTDGNLWRWTDTEDEQIQVANLVYSASGFGYDSPDAASVSSVTVTFVATLPPDEDTPEPGQREISTQVHLRNR